MSAPAEGGAPPRTSRSARLSTLEIAALAVLALSLPVRISNAIILPVLRDYDGVGHALNIVSLYDGSLPEPTSWGGFHAPLYHAVCALLWRLSPASIPAHVLFRGVSLAATGAALFAVHRILRAHCGRSAALVSVTVSACSPLLLVASTMLGNETTCMLFVTLALVAVSRPERAPTLRHGIEAGLAVGLAALSKATGLLATPVVLLFLLPGRPRRPARFVPAFAALAAAGVVALPYYGVRLSSGAASPLAVVSGAALSPDAADEMAAQPPGERFLSDYLRIPRATFRNPTVDDPDLVRNVPGLLYATVWGDAQAQYLPQHPPAGVLVGSFTTVYGLLPTAIALGGLVAVLRRPRRHAFALPGLTLLTVLGLAFVWYAWQVPRFSAVKGSYLLPALLPATTLLAVGLRGMPDRLRRPVEAILLLGALGTTAAFWLAVWR